MKIEDFNTNYMGQRPIFNESLITKGSVIHIYSVNGYGKTKYIKTGIVEAIDFSSLKYFYYDSVHENMSSGYLYPKDVLESNTDLGEWDKSGKYVFEIEKRSQSVNLVDFDLDEELE